MNEQRRQYAADLLERSRRHDAGKADRLERYRNLEPETAELLSVLVRACAPERVLEIGTSNGYSTIWLADACEEIGAKLVSVDNEPSRTSEARAHLDALNLQADLRVEDAAQTLSRSTDAAWDLVFLDAERPAYAGYWPQLLRAVRSGGLIAIDNVLSHSNEVADVTHLILATPGVSSTVIPTGAGLRLAVRYAFPSATARHPGQWPAEAGDHAVVDGLAAPRSPRGRTPRSLSSHRGIQTPIRSATRAGRPPAFISPRRSRDFRGGTCLAWEAGRPPNCD